MTLDAFWEIVDEARHATKQTSEIPEWLVGRLSQLSEREIVSFAQHLADCLGRAYDARLWIAGTIACNGWGMSEDGFDYFRGWLVAQGRETYECALADPDSLATLESLSGSGKFPELEFMLYVPGMALARKKTRRPSQGRHDFRERIFPPLANSELKGQQLRDLRHLYPKLTARFPKSFSGSEPSSS